MNALNTAQIDQVNGGVTGDGNNGGCTGPFINFQTSEPQDTKLK